MLDDLFKRTEHLVQQSVECMLKGLYMHVKQTRDQFSKGRWKYSQDCCIAFLRIVLGTKILHDIFNQ